MANIPVEKKSGGSIWPWLIGLLVLLGLVILLFQLFFDEENDVDTEPTSEQVEQVEPRATEPSAAGAAAAGGVITSASMLVEAENPAQLAGRSVQLSGMEVTSVLGDSAFYATSQSGDREFLVALNEVTPTPQDQTEGRYDVTEGQVLDIDGGVRELTREAEAWGLSEEEANQMQDDVIYIRAQSLNIVEQASN